MIDRTATYIGLRTYLYRPPTTNCLGGATGAGVPMPSVTNRANAWRSTAVPQMIRSAPNARNGSQGANGSQSRQRVSHQGTTPATKPGARTKKIKLPNAATALRMLILPSG